eukprot:1891200-Alexandrium_andersonii.AAC.1
MADLAFQQQGGTGRRAPEGQRSRANTHSSCPRTVGKPLETAGNSKEPPEIAGNRWKQFQAASS